MKIVTAGKKESNQELQIWDKVLSEARKPIKCAFSILKNRFQRLKDGLRLHIEDEVAYCMLACVVLHNISLEHNVKGNYFGTDDIENVNVDNFISSAYTNTGHKTRISLLHYVRSHR